MIYYNPNLFDYSHIKKYIFHHIISYTHTHREIQIDTIACDIPEIIKVLVMIHYMSFTIPRG